MLIDMDSGLCIFNECTWLSDYYTGGFCEIAPGKRDHHEHCQDHTQGGSVGLMIANHHGVVEIQ